VDLRSVRVISDDVKQMVEFYEQATGLPARWATEDFAELVAPSCTLAIGSTRTVQLFGEGAARPADNHSAIVEFLVDDVDEEYEKLKHLVSEFVQAPTTMPWGNRSLLFRDPDGNLVNFFAPLSQDAVKRLER
jgi:catechol 2,3-dioxygenase-like lactoylglutathione lyase family enzyme